VPHSRTDFCTFDQLAGVPVHWANWGRVGWRHLQLEFKKQLETALLDLFDCWQWGVPLGIRSGGAYPGRSPKKPGDQHWKGTAFDLSGFKFKDEKNGVWEWELVAEWKEEPREALALEAVLRRHIPQILGPHYNRAHRSHFHCDAVNVGGFQTRSPCDVRFVQACLLHFWGLDVGVNGRWNRGTIAAVTTVLEELGHPMALTSPTVWGAFLESVWRWGFGKVEEQE